MTPYVGTRLIGQRLESVPALILKQETFNEVELK
jgi:hypothetical protein